MPKFMDTVPWDPYRDSCLSEAEGAERAVRDVCFGGREPS